MVSEQYLNYNDYKQLGGTIDQMPFNLIEYEARKLIDKYTFSRLTKLSSQNENVKQCMFKLIVELNSTNTKEGQNKAITSESTNGYSVNYGTITKEQIKAKNKELKDIIYTYLADDKLDDGTPYLYRGC